MSILTTEFIKAATGLKLKFDSYEQLYPLFDLLKEHLPLRTSVPTLVVESEDSVEIVEKPKKIKKAKKVSAEEAELLAPADASDAGESSDTTPMLGATDPFRNNKYRLTTLNLTLCMGRRYDEKNPVVGTRIGDDGANGIIFPELQCVKKPVPGCRLCSVCAKNEAEYKADPSKPPKRWYGRLDEPMYAKARIIGSEWFLTKYPAGIAEAPLVTSTTPVKNKKPKKPEASTDPTLVEVKAKKVKKPAAEPEPTMAIVAAPAKAKKAKKAEKPVAEVEATETAPETDAPASATKPVKVKKASVAVDGDAHVVEWVTFVFDGTPLVRHTKTGNVYQCDRTKHRLEDMVQRDKYEGKWRDGRLDPYADEDDE